MDFNYKIFKNKYGFKFLSINKPNTNLVFINISIKNGSDNETMKTLEYSHFLEHILTTLTSNKYPDAFKNRF